MEDATVAEHIAFQLGDALREAAWRVRHWWTTWQMTLLADLVLRARSRRHAGLVRSARVRAAAQGEGTA